ncbi:MAG: four helix bundle protein, partial [Rhodothermales bacterium]
MKKMDLGLHDVEEMVHDDSLEGMVQELAERWDTERQIQSFEDLHVWQYCRDVRLELMKLARALPPEETFRLSDQVIRA